MRLYCETLPPPTCAQRIWRDHHASIIGASVGISVVIVYCALFMMTFVACAGGVP